MCIRDRWDISYRLGLANELSKGRPWLGTIHLVAVYGRDLSATEVQNNFKAGLDGESVQQEFAANLLAEKEKFFDEEIVPILSKHCLECHDTATQKGKLDLSRKSKAFALSNGDKAIIPGKAAESLDWEVVESNDMPDEREPLTVGEKKLLANGLTMAPFGRPRRSILSRIRSTGGRRKTGFAV